MRRLTIFISMLAFAGACNLDEETYEDWDMDLSGDVNHDEFYDRYYNAGYWHLWDRDGDEVIDEEEWNMGLDEYYNKFDQSTYTFSGFDLNKDGMLDDEELTDAVFTIYDTDGDGNIEAVEFEKVGYPNNEGI